MWLVEFGRVIYPAVALTPAARLRGIPAVEMAPLLDGHPDPLFHAFPDGITIDDPIEGRISGEEAIRAYIERGIEWVRSSNASPQLAALTLGRNRAVGELSVEMGSGDQKRSVPVGIVAEVGSERRDLAIRIYHSARPVSGESRPRPRLLPADPAAKASDVVATLIAALVAGDAAKAVSAFEPDGSVIEASDLAARHHGTPELKAWYAARLASGGLGIELATVTDDGVRAAIEYTVTRAGGVDLTPEAGLVVIERGALGPIAEARLYADPADRG